MFEYVMTFPCEVKPGSIADVHERIIRCKDCEFCRNAKYPTSIDIYFCVKNGVDKTYAPVVFVKADGFCAWAKRKEVE